MNSYSRKNSCIVDKMRTWAPGGLSVKVRIQSCVTVLESKSKKRNQQGKSELIE